MQQICKMCAVAGAHHDHGSLRRTADWVGWKGPRCRARLHLRSSEASKICCRRQTRYRDSPSSAALARRTHGQSSSKLTHTALGANRLCARAAWQWSGAWESHRTSPLDRQHIRLATSSWVTNARVASRLRFRQSLRTGPEKTAIVAKY